MSYRLIDSNALAMKYPEVNNMPCIYADLPNGLDRRFYSVNMFAEPKRGKWINLASDPKHLVSVDICSKCGQIRNGYSSWHYCPNCGAKMDGDVKDGE